ncbi:6-O-methylguanine DNA methyltransferase [Phyllosticta citrichinensis]|uniref:6-O-methylguanine DNA methyltransferase n=1 Tax=Phyllosticta citrichinensis TaxID=1130410 RepID=A0ABR1XW66_9PEZI
MPRRSEDAAAWFAAVYQAVQEVPYGKVTSYGHIARLVGRPECPRQVGVCLKHLASSPNAADESSRNRPKWHTANVPWQRVINSKGIISPRGPSGASRQAAALRAEGVHVDRGSLGEYLVSLETYGWFPDMLPSEEAELESSDPDSDSDMGEGNDVERAAR